MEKHLSHELHEKEKGHHTALLPPDTHIWMVDWDTSEVYVAWVS